MMIISNSYHIVILNGLFLKKTFFQFKKKTINLNILLFGSIVKLKKKHFYINNSIFSIVFGKFSIFDNIFNEILRLIFLQI